MAEQTAAKSPVEILEVARRVFAATHWIVGSYAARFQVPVNTAGGFEEKVGGCAVGGLRYAALAPMDHALDEAWMYANFDDLGGEELDTSDPADEAIAESYLAALVALSDEIGYPPFLAGNVLWEDISAAESHVVAWNDDDHDYEDERERRQVVEQEILPVFDRAIAKLKGSTATEGGE